nr:MAG TPA: hypothetical protein [Caudoviricetes sp.]
MILAFLFFKQNTNKKTHNTKNAVRLSYIYLLIYGK